MKSIYKIYQCWKTNSLFRDGEDDFFKKYSPSNSSFVDGFKSNMKIFINGFLDESDDENKIESHELNLKSSKNRDEVKENQNSNNNDKEAEFNLKFGFEQYEQIFTQQ